MGVLMYLSLAALASGVCNCVQCHVSTHIVGSQTWCRCCYNAMSECANDCPNSVFTYDGCAENSFDDRCLYSSSSSEQPTPQPEMSTTPLSTTLITPTASSLLLPLVIRPCNCVGCSSSDIVTAPAPSSWCRCCAQTFKSACNDSSTTTDETCKLSVFTRSGCEEQNYADTCL